MVIFELYCFIYCMGALLTQLDVRMQWAHLHGEEHDALFRRGRVLGSGCHPSRRCEALTSL